MEIKLIFKYKLSCPSNINGPWLVYCLHSEFFHGVRWQEDKIEWKTGTKILVWPIIHYVSFQLSHSITAFGPAFSIYQVGWESGQLYFWSLFHVNPELSPWVKAEGEGMLDRLKQEVPQGAGACGSTLLCLELLFCYQRPQNNNASLLLYWLRLADISRQNQQALSKLRLLMTPEGAWKFSWETNFNFIPEIDVRRGAVLLWGTYGNVITLFFKWKNQRILIAGRVIRSLVPDLLHWWGSKRPKETCLVLRYLNEFMAEPETDLGCSDFLSGVIPCTSLLWNTFILFTRLNSIFWNTGTMLRSTKSLSSREVKRMIITRYLLGWVSVWAICTWSGTAKR